MSVQLLLGREHPWVPSRIRRLALAESRFESAYEKAIPVTRRIDRILRRRWKLFAGPTSRRVIAAVVIGLSLLMIPLELVPFAVAIPAAGIALFGIGLSASDGLVVAIGGILATAAFYAGLTRWPF